ncbi:MAG: ACT domain-containing protein [Spirochaetales bacterium]|nr:ACT domain-containing protein [Spirochaetales bacterium]
MNSVVTVVGKDSVGIISTISGVMADNSINILDISQTIMDGYFTMIMLVDISIATKEIKEIRAILDEAGVKLGVSVTIQHEQVFQAMHRI